MGVKQLAVANGPNIFQMLLVYMIDAILYSYRCVSTEVVDLTRWNLSAIRRRTDDQDHIAANCRSPTSDIV